MKRGRRKSKECFPCPLCGADVPADALACPECGSDSETGWFEDADKWEADIPAGYGDEDDFDYDEFVRKEFPEHAKPSVKRSARKGVLVLIVVLLCLALLITYVLRG